MRRHRWLVLVFALLAAIVAWVPPVQALTYQVPPTIPADCSVDVTADLNAFYATVPDGSTVTFPDNACYKIEGTLAIHSRNGLTFSGNASARPTFRADTAGPGVDRPIWRLRHGSNITLANLIVDGAHPNPCACASAYVPAFEGHHAIEIESVAGGLIQNVLTRDTYGDGILIEKYPGPTEPLSTDWIVIDSSFTRTGRHGITLAGAERITFTRVTLDAIGYDAIDMEPDAAAQAIKHVSYTDVTTGTIFLTPVAVSGIAPIEDITITRLTMTAHAGTPAIDINGRQRALGTWWHRFLIQDSVILGGGSGVRAGVELKQIADVVYRNNTITFKGVVPTEGVRLKDARHVAVYHATFAGPVSQPFTADAASLEYAYWTATD